MLTGRNVHGARAQLTHLINMTLLNRPYTVRVRALAASGDNKLRHVRPRAQMAEWSAGTRKRTITTQPGAKRTAPAGSGAMILKSIRFLFVCLRTAREVSMYPICSMFDDRYAAMRHQYANARAYETCRSI